MVIKITRKRAVKLPQINKKGDWIDLYMPKYEECTYTRGDCGLIDLGIAIKLPKGYEAIIVPRSSTFKNFGIMQVNSVGIIDNTYCGDNDTWKFGYYALKNSSIPPDARICQFRIQLSQKATAWQKIKALFDSKIVFEEVEFLDGKDRGGIGSTGI